MSPLTLFLAKLLGAMLLILSAWLATRKAHALSLADRIVRDPGEIFLIGLLRLGLGLAIVIGHSIWNSALAIVVSLLGWLMLASGVLTLFLPTERLIRLNDAVRADRYYGVFVGIVALLGLYLAIGGFAG